MQTEGEARARKMLRKTIFESTSGRWETRGKGGGRMVFFVHILVVIIYKNGTK